MREKLIAIIQAAVKGCSAYWAGLIADALIANGVGGATDNHVGCNDVTVREKGEWVNPYINRYGHPCHCCSVCGFKASYQDKNFCPNCGADMRGAEHDA